MFLSVKMDYCSFERTGTNVLILFRATVPRISPTQRSYTKACWEMRKK